MLDKIAYVIVFVSNMKQSIDFYKNVLKMPLKSESEHWTEFLHGETMLTLHSATEDHKVIDKSVKDSVVLGFFIDNIDAMAAELKDKGVKFHGEPKDEEFGRHATILDPDGYMISLTQLKRMG